MKNQVAIAIAALIIHGLAIAGEGGSSSKSTTAKPAKKTLNTNIYEKSSDERSFTANVRMVRQNGTDWEVLFDKPAGVYTVSDDHQSALVDAQKNKTTVTVRVNEETNRILSVKANKPAQKEN